MIMSATCRSADVARVPEIDRANPTAWVRVGHVCRLPDATVIFGELRWNRKQDHRGPNRVIHGVCDP